MSHEFEESFQENKIRPDEISAAQTNVTRSRRRGFIALFAITCVVALVIAAAYAPSGESSSKSLPINPEGSLAPTLVMPSLSDTGDIDLSDYIGTPVVLNFWASWCVTCKEEAALLGEAARKWEEQGVIFLGVDVSDKRDSARAFATQYDFDYDSFFDSSGVVSKQWGVTGFPETFFIDKTGRIISKYISAIDAETLDNRINEILP